jgi:hypothetical protein
MMIVPLHVLQESRRGDAQTANKRRRLWSPRQPVSSPSRRRTPAYRVPAASPFRPFSLAPHSHGGTGALSAHRPR